MFYDVSSFSTPYVISRLFSTLKISTINVIFKSKSLLYTNHSLFIKQKINTYISKYFALKLIRWFLKDVEQLMYYSSFLRSIIIKNMKLYRRKIIHFPCCRKILHYSYTKILFMVTQIYKVTFILVLATS